VALRASALKKVFSKKAALGFQLYSLNVYPHFVHRKNWVDDSSAPLVCTCHTYAWLFPHLGHSIVTVGRVWRFCSFLLMTTIWSSVVFLIFESGMADSIFFS